MVKEIKKVPELRFPECEDLLNQYSLEDITSWGSGGTPSKQNPSYWDGNIPWISASSMYSNYFTESKLMITEEGLENGSKLVEKGTILLLVRGSMLYNKIPIGIAGKNVSFNQDVKSVKVNEKSISEFLLQWFLAKEHHLLNMVVGTGIGAGKLDTQDLKSLAVKLPTLPEQQKIAAFLSAVDQKIQQLTRKKELLEQYKKGVMQKIFSREIRFKDENGDDYPDWEEKRLGDVVKIQMGQSPNSQNYTDNTEDMLLIQGNADLKNGEVIPRMYTTEITKKSDKGDIIMTVRAPVGDIAISKFESCIGRGVCAIKGSLFFYHMLDNFNINGTWNRLSQGSTFESVNSSDIKGLLISVPDKKEQELIDDFLSVVSKKVIDCQVELEQVAIFKNGLLQKMFV